MAMPDGRAPNVATRTFGGQQLWADVRFRQDFRIQQNALTGHHRLLDPHDVRRAWGSFEHCEAVLDRLTVRLQGAPEPEHVVLLLHGLGRTRRSMQRLSGGLRQAGFATAPLSYASTRRPLEAHADALCSVIEGFEGERRVSFVTHSLGGIVVRYLLSRPGPWRDRITPHRMVMLAPPNQGCSVARRIDGPLLRAVLGRSAVQIAGGSTRELGPPPIPCGVIAGSLREGRGIHGLVPEASDGLVTVSETELEGMEAHLTIEAIHTFIMNHPEVEAAVTRFLTQDPPAFC